MKIKDNLETPILFLIFNRPDTTEKVLESIRSVKPERLYIACDGPRTEDEKLLIHQLRKNTLNNIDWECEIHTLFRNKNLGCKNAVSSAIDWFFNNEEMGIILEDDCIPSIDFFEFCEITLEKYKNSETIFHIDGTNFGTPSNKNLLHFSKYALIWGWASWRRAWSHYDIKMTDYPQSIQSNCLKAILSKKEIEYWIPKLDKAYNNDIDTWDYQWFYTIWKNQAITIRPDKNLIKNIGFNSDATHTKKSNKFLKNMLADSLNFELPLPNEIEINYKLDEEISYKRFNIGKSIFKRFAQKLFNI